MVVVFAATRLSRKQALHDMLAGTLVVVGKPGYGASLTSRRVAVAEAVSDDASPCVVLGGFRQGSVAATRS